MTCTVPTMNDQKIPVSRVKFPPNSFKARISKCLIEDEIGSFSLLAGTIKVLRGFLTVLFGSSENGEKDEKVDLCVLFVRVMRINLICLIGLVHLCVVYIYWPNWALLSSFILVINICLWTIITICKSENVYVYVFWCTHKDWFTLYFEIHFWKPCLTQYCKPPL